MLRVGKDCRHLPEESFPSPGHVANPRPLGKVPVPGKIFLTGSASARASSSFAVHHRTRYEVYGAGANEYLEMIRVFLSDNFSRELYLLSTIIFLEVPWPF